MVKAFLILLGEVMESAGVVGVLSGSARVVDFVFITGFFEILGWKVQSWTESS